MAISHPIVAEIARGVYCINEFGMDSLFLIVGDSRALLIDTGTAAFDLPALIGRLSLLPMDVALTHGHMDHAGGMGWFHRVHLHPADFDLARSITLTMRQDYTRLIRRIAGGFFDVDALNVRDFSRQPELLPLGEGDCFDLGGVHVDVYETPGHTPGGLSYLVREQRLLITGDACNPNTLLFPFLPDGRRAPHASAEGLMATARKLQRLSSLADRIYNGHTGFAAEICFLPIPAELPREIETLCRQLIDGTAQWQEGGQMGLNTSVWAPHGRICFDPQHYLEDQ